jgi:hypothetical protein
MWKYGQWLVWFALCFLAQIVGEYTSTNHLPQSSERWLYLFAQALIMLGAIAFVSWTIQAAARRQRRPQG